jgi:hypothetical protein
MTNASTKPLKLTDAQLVLLSAAAQRPDGPVSSSPAARTLAALTRRGLLAESADGVRITAEGYAALGIEPPQSSNAAKDEEQINRDAAEPRKKREIVIDLLGRKQGATLEDLVAATGWLPHTTRAALTGLRKKGFALDSDKPADGPRVYRIGGKPAASAAA